MRKTQLCSFALLCALAPASIGCSGQPSADDPPPSSSASGPSAGSASDAPGAGDEPESSGATADSIDDGAGSPDEVDEGVSPWGNSVPDDDQSPDGCAAAGSGPGPTCSSNTDCGICHDGSNCGRVANREEIERLGAACRHRDAAECEYALSRCCDGVCRITPD